MEVHVHLMAHWVTNWVGRTDLSTAEPETTDFVSDDDVGLVL